MAKSGRRFIFHGAFGTKAKAKRKEHSIKGGFIRRIKIRGSIRYVVMSKR